MIILESFQVMSRSSTVGSLTEEVLCFRKEAFYDLIEQLCGNIILEIIQAQDMSSVECLLDLGNIFAFLELDADELIPLKRRAGILLNDGHFVLKKGIVYKFEHFLSILRRLNEQYSASITHYDSTYPSDLIIPQHLLLRFLSIRTLVVYSILIANSKYNFTLLNVMLNNIIRNLSIDEKGYHATDDDSDEEFGLNNDSDVVHNATTSSYRGMRLFNHVKDDIWRIRSSKFISTMKRSIFTNKPDVGF